MGATLLLLTDGTCGMVDDGDDFRTDVVVDREKGHVATRYGNAFKESDVISHTMLEEDAVVVVVVVVVPC